MAADCHQNAVRTKLDDGERGDSYRRMMLWFSNHLLVRAGADGQWNDRDLKDALRSGRIYGAFELFGYPRGFDFHALENSAVREMGEEAHLSNPVTLEATLPTITNLSPKAPAPTLTLRILRAREGGWDLVHTGSEDVSFAVTEPGAYRAEVRIVPAHLAGYLGMYEDALAVEYPYIYSNPIYVEP